MFNAIGRELARELERYFSVQNGISVQDCKSQPAPRPRGQAWCMYNPDDCEIVVMYNGDRLAVVNLDRDAIVVWTGGSPCGIAGKVDYADPEFIEAIAGLIGKVTQGGSLRGTDLVKVIAAMDGSGTERPDFLSAMESIVVGYRVSEAHAG